MTEAFERSSRGQTLIVKVAESQLSNVATVEAFAAALLQLRKQHDKPFLIVNLAGVTFLATPVVNALIQARKQFDAMVVVGLNENIRRAFALMKLDEALTLAADVEAGFEALPAEATSGDT